MLDASPAPGGWGAPSFRLPPPAGSGGGVDMGVGGDPAGTLLCQEQEVGCVFRFEYLKSGPSQKIGGAFLFSAAH